MDARQGGTAGHVSGASWRSGVDVWWTVYDPDKGWSEDTSFGAHRGPLLLSGPRVSRAAAPACRGVRPDRASALLRKAERRGSDIG